MQPWRSSSLSATQGEFMKQGGIIIDANVRPLCYTHCDIDECNVLDGDACAEYVSSFLRMGSRMGIIDIRGRVMGQLNG